MILLMDHFANKDNSHERTRLQQREWFIKAQRQAEQQKDAQDARDADIMDFAVEAILAAETEIKAFRAKLDAYDEATVRALELNQQQIDEITQRLQDVQARIQDKLDRAYVMDDGRRVFLTKDRSQAFDEHGKKVSRDALDYDQIPQTAPTWESFQEDSAQKDKLNDGLNGLHKEREDLIKYQDKLDAARERAGAEDFTQDELDGLDADLKAAMPDAVAHQMPGYQPATPAPDASAAFKPTAAPAPVPIARQAAPSFQPETM